MLSRTADHLFWMSRYTERAENTARMLDVNFQTTLLPQSKAVALVGWEGLLTISELMPAYSALQARILVTMPNPLSISRTCHEPRTIHATTALYPQR